MPSNGPSTFDDTTRYYPAKDTPQVNRTKIGQSTTATLPDRNFINGLRGNASLLASSSAPLVTTALLVRHASLATALVVGLLPALPYLLASLVFVVGLVASPIAMIMVLACSGDRYEEVARRVDELLARIINAPIALMTLTPLKLPKRETKRTVQAPVDVSPATFPAADPSSPPTDPEAIFLRLWENSPLQAARGRHAKPETAPAPPSTADSGSGSTAEQDDGCVTPMAA